MTTTHPRERVNSLPFPLTSLVGRQREREIVCEFLLRDDVRLLTLTGPGGVGKTRLALQVAAELGHTYVDGVWFVPLAAIQDPALVIPTIAQTLGLLEMGDHSPIDLLKIFLRERSVLLLLDNFEQVVAAASQLSVLLTICPQLTLLVTSRESLRIASEQEFPVPPLALPGHAPRPVVSDLSQVEAVALFLQRARAVAPDFTLTEDNAPVIAELCTRMDGLPLAIELAAARVKVLTPPDLLARMDRRLSVLSRDSRDVPQRLRTMYHAIAWSHDLLTPTEQVVFRRLSVFASGSTLESAEAIISGSQEASSDVLEGITSLVEKSLLRRLEQPDGSSRYQMFETIREFGVERLRASGDEDATRRRLATWCLTLAEQSHREMWGPTQREWLARLEAEHDNVRAVFVWAFERGETEIAQRLAGELQRFWWFRGHLTEGRAWAERALMMPQQTSAIARAKALSAAGRLASAQGDDGRAIEALEESLVICRNIGDAHFTATSL